MRKTVFIPAFLLIAGGVFALHPAVEYGRSFIPEEIFINSNCGCDCILASRPWYSKLNYWFWLWITTIPLFVFAIRPNISKTKKIIFGFFIATLCYMLMNLSIRLHWDIRNALFIPANNLALPNQVAWGMGCADIRDGASLIYYLLFGWVPAILYTVLWYIIRYGVSFWNRRPI